MNIKYIPPQILASSFVCSAFWMVKSKDGKSICLESITFTIKRPKKYLCKLYHILVKNLTGETTHECVQVAFNIRWCYFNTSMDITFLSCSLIINKLLNYEKADCSWLNVVLIYIFQQLLLLNAGVNINVFLFNLKHIFCSFFVLIINVKQKC